MRRARVLQGQPSQQTGVSVSLPSPLGGWNARDSEAAMASTDAITLDNWFPDVGRVRIRNGDTSYATSVGDSAVPTLAEYHFGATKKFIAAGSGSIYDITGGGSATPIATGFAVNRWQTTPFNNRLLMFNGTDTAQSYNGTSITAAGWTGTGLDATKLIQGAVWKQRAFAIEDGTLSAWYGAVGGITGSMAELDLSEYANGGTLKSVGTWSRDQGDGPDDLLVFLTTAGQALIYSGSGPEETDFGLVGIYQFPPPVGNRCMVSIGGELVIITSGGFFPMSSALAQQFMDQSMAISDKIRGAVRVAAQDNASLFGWEGVYIPGESKLVFNVPNSPTTFVQFVRNTITGAWCRFVDRNMLTQAISNGVLYGGGFGGNVWRLDDGTIDTSQTVTAIRAEARMAFNNFGVPGQQKRVTAVRPYLSAAGTLSYSVGFDVDFTRRALEASLHTVQSDGTPWEEESVLWESWDVPWGTGGGSISQWVSFGVMGRWLSLHMLASTSIAVEWFSTDILGIPGGTR